MRRVLLATTLVAGLLFMHAFMIVGPTVAKGPTANTAMTMVALPGEAAAPTPSGHGHGGSRDGGGHVAHHLAGLCLAVLLAAGFVVIGQRPRARRRLPGADGPVPGSLLARLVRRPTRPPALADLCVLTC